MKLDGWWISAAGMLLLIIFGISLDSMVDTNSWNIITQFCLVGMDIGILLMGIGMGLLTKDNFKYKTGGK